MSILGSSLLVLLFFVYIIFCSIGYLIVSRKREKEFRMQVKALKKTYGKEILVQLDMIKNNIKIPKKNLIKIKSKIRDKAYEQAFNETIIKFNKNKSNHKFTKVYMRKYGKYIDNLISKKYSDEEKSYIAFLLGEYKIDNEKINDFLLEGLNSDSVYLRYNSFSSISKIGNVDYFIEALSIVSDNEQDLNNKIVIDVIDDFGGDIYKLYEELINRFYTLSNKSKCTFIDHMANKKNKVLSGILLNILKKNDTEDEVKSSIIKYFGVVRYELSKPTLLKILKSEKWEHRALSVRALENYSGEDIIDEIMQTIKDENWYVRLNSANTLLKLNISDEKLSTILNGNDKYARDIMNYVLSLQYN